ncbi:MAG TPA: (4Fe-4S)-binding protein [Vicinamibacterales bacterium]|nr:(4Fe-4S)-binding protein [Vicinamibacterales bacterium]
MTHDGTHHYTNGEITVVWKPAVCQHSGVCVRGLGQVFDPRRKPWIELQHSDSTTIAEQVQRCPSGALSWFKNDK